MNNKRNRDDESGDESDDESEVDRRKRIRGYDSDDEEDYRLNIKTPKTKIVRQEYMKKANLKSEIIWGFNDWLKLTRDELPTDYPNWQNQYISSNNEEDIRFFKTILSNYAHHPFAKQLINQWTLNTNNNDLIQQFDQQTRIVSKEGGKKSKKRQRNPKKKKSQKKKKW
jgi:hypothetical protein